MFCINHINAMDFLYQGIDHAVITFWFGHATTEISMVYIHIDMTLKEKALAKMSNSSINPSRYKPDDKFLKNV